MIQIGNNKIKGAFLGKDELKYIYIGKTCVYYKETPSTGDTQGIKVCFAVVDNISTYKDRIYDTVYDRGSKSWYILNDFNEYEKYGVVDEVSTLDRATRVKNAKFCSVNLTSHGSWITATTNPDSSTYDAYMSDGSHGVNNAFDIMVITLSTGFTEFDVYIRSNAESNYDYTVIGNLDSTIPTSNTANNNSNVKAHTCGSQNSSTALSGYKKVSYTDIDPTKTHTIWVEYRKDSSDNANDDRGYVLIPKLPAYTIQGTTVYDGKLVALSSDQHEYKYTNGSWVDKGEITTTESVKTYPVAYEKYDDPAAILNFSTLEEANSYKGCLYPDEICTINDENYYAVRKKDDGSFSWEECPLSWKATYPSGKTVYVTGDTTIDKGDIKNDAVDVKIGNGVTSIGNSAFQSCKSLTSITISNSVTSLGWYAFDGCTSLTSITIPNSVTSIGRYVFGSCTSLARIKVDDGNTMYDSRENCNAIIQTSQNTLITGCKNTVIPNSVTTIGDEAFRKCESLTSITIPNSVTSIGRYAFYICTSLASITIPDSVTSIGEDAFGRCESLTSITIPNSVTTIGDEAFYICTSLRSITIPNSVTSIGRNAFCSCTSLTNITIPDSVTSIGEDAFGSCKSLTSITIPNSVTSLGWYAFDGCTSLTSITIPDSVTSIGRQAFQSCSSLTSIIYQGARSQWNSISVDRSFPNIYANITVHCTDGDYKMTSGSGSI